MSVKPHFPAHFKNPEGSLKRYKELRHRFRDSENAVYLIDYARRHDVKFFEDSDYLAERGIAGSFFREVRQVLYSRHNPAFFILHEFRHAMQNDWIVDIAPDLTRGVFGQSLRRTFLYNAIIEADACYFENKSFLEMKGDYEHLKDPKVFFLYFISPHVYMKDWFESSAKDFFNAHSFAKAVVARPDRGLVAFLDRRYNAFMLKRLTVAEKKLDQDSVISPDVSDISYLRRLSETVCRGRDGENYLFSGLTEDQQTLLLEKIWKRIFTPEIRAQVKLAEHRRTIYPHRLQNAIRNFHGLESLPAAS